MGSTVSPATARRLASAILSLIVLLIAAGIASAAPADFTERDLSPPQGVRARPRAPRKAVQSAAYEEQQDQEEPADADTADQGPADEGVPAASNAAQGKAAASGELTYVIREGDSIGAVAAMFHLPPQEIFRRNHLSESSTLHVGQVLHIPNPYVAQVRDLQRQIQDLQGRTQSLESKLKEAGTRERAFDARIEELSGINKSLEHDVAVLPWWRRATTVAITLSTVLLGIALLSLVQWILIRWRFAAVAQANEKLSKLDQRYKVLLARAELRMQQLYGRRRAAAEAAAAARGQEEFELDRLARDVKEVLERELNQLGVPRQVPARRSRLREWLAGVGSPVAVRPGRR